MILQVGKVKLPDRSLTFEFVGLQVSPYGFRILDTHQLQIALQMGWNNPPEVVGSFHPKGPEPKPIYFWPFKDI